MNKGTGIFLLIFGMVFASLSAEAQVQVYRWKDKDGRTVVGSEPPKNDPTVEKITVREPPAPSKSAPSRGRTPEKNWKREDDYLRNRLDQRKEAEANAERNRERQKRACEDARARQAYVDSIRGRAVWRTDPATGEQTLLSDDDRATMESEARSAMQRNDCGADE